MLRQACGLCLPFRLSGNKLYLPDYLHWRVIAISFIQYFMKKTPAIVLLTGAGISAESGLATFRDTDGTWERHRIEEVATPQAFQTNPERVLQFYNERRHAADAARPNAAHKALAALERNWPGAFLLVTQNVDRLHEAAGSQNLRHMHGSLDRALCTHCGASVPWQGDMHVTSACPRCDAAGGLRPDIVWFGEMPCFMPEIERALDKADIFAAIGTSGQVYPAAGFATLAHIGGARTFELNLDCGKAGLTDFDERIAGKATETVPAFVERLLTAFAA